MNRRYLATVLAGLALAGCSSPEQGPTAGPGDPDVYKTIASLHSCKVLREQFDLAERTSRRAGRSLDASWSEIGIAYMEAADARMREVGCS
jgi:hypothetical protein